MPAAVAATPTSGVAKMTVLRIDATDIPDTDSTAYNANNTPAEPELRYYFDATCAGQPTLKSHVFAPSQAGKHTWNSIVLPGAGTWTIAIKKVADDSTVASTSFVAS